MQEETAAKPRQEVRKRNEIQKQQRVKQQGRVREALRDGGNLLGRRENQIAAQGPQKKEKNALIRSEIVAKE